MNFTPPELGYRYDALEPFIDESTMALHHGKHHQAYVDNLNKAIMGEDVMLSIKDLCKNAVLMDKPAIRNNGGGHYNHSLFWKILTPGGSHLPTGDLEAAIVEAFGSFDDFKNVFIQAALTRFGSGWAWLCVHPEHKLCVCSTPNQDNPLMPSTGCGGTPILGLDVWEHAYYLKYQNRRADYINAFFEVINWSIVSETYNELS